MVKFGQSLHKNSQTAILASTRTVKLFRECLAPHWHRSVAHVNLNLARRKTPVNAKLVREVQQKAAWQTKKSQVSKSPEHLGRGSYCATIQKSLTKCEVHCFVQNHLLFKGFKEDEPFVGRKQEGVSEFCSHQDSDVLVDQNPMCSVIVDTLPMRPECSLDGNHWLLASAECGASRGF